MSRFTPGPWEYQERSDDYTHIVRGPHERFVVQLSQDTSGVAEANARLIAAAPEMYEFVKFTLAYLEDRGEAGGRLDAWAKDILKEIDDDD